MYQAANQGYLPAILVMMKLYQQGLGVQKSARTALVWQKKAADLGHAASQYQMGMADLQKQNYSHAYKWIKLAALQGFKAALAELQSLNHTLSPQMQQRGNRLVSHWFNQRRHP
ncbi:tetratricopeptide repeat protein [Magnetococcus sp. PR-3]|uniref:tetratricopeptide repeat protein n=1 Tax=Magnetococcus sp. PR-3 TaxID=3120355 RepID=UPI002FCE152B